jgi:hypothetical protein
MRGGGFTQRGRRRPLSDYARHGTASAAIKSCCLSCLLFSFFFFFLLFFPHEQCHAHACSMRPCMSLTLAGWESNACACNRTTRGRKPLRPLSTRGWQLATKGTAGLARAEAAEPGEPLPSRRRRAGSRGGDGASRVHGSRRRRVGSRESAETRGCEGPTEVVDAAQACAAIGGDGATRAPAGARGRRRRRSRAWAG